MLRVVEISLRSLRRSDDPSTQDTLREINTLHRQAALTLSELDTLVNEKLRNTSNSGTLEKPKLAKWAWLRHEKDLERLRLQIRNTSSALSTALTALNGIQLATLQQYVQILWAVRD